MIDFHIPRLFYGSAREHPAFVYFYYEFSRSSLKNTFEYQTRHAVFVLNNTHWFSTGKHLLVEFFPKTQNLKILMRNYTLIE